MVTAPVERSEVRGHRQRIGKSAALTEGGACPHARSAAAAALNDHQNLADLTFFAALTRAREATRIGRGEQSDLLGPAWPHDPLKRIGDGAAGDLNLLRCPHARARGDPHRPRRRRRPHHRVRRFRFGGGGDGDGAGRAQRGTSLGVLFCGEVCLYSAGQQVCGRLWPLGHTSSAQSVANGGKADTTAPSERGGF